jgi:hypothetical protein
MIPSIGSKYLIAKTEFEINICDASSMMTIWNEGGLETSLWKDLRTPHTVPTELGKKFLHQ